MENGVRNGLAPAGEPRAIGSVISQHSGGVRAVREKIDRLPSAAAALTWLIKQVRNEQRTDLPVSVGELAMSPTGKILHKRGGPSVWLTRNALVQLTRMLEAPPSAGNYLAAVPTPRRAVETNHILERNGGRRKPLILRLRRLPGADAWHCYAVVSENYAPVDPDAVAQRLLDRLSSHSRLGDARCDVVYSGERTIVRLFEQSDVASHALAKDESFASVLSLALGDDKSRAIGVDIAALRSACLNLMLVKPDKAGLFRSRHVGDPGQLVEQLIAATEVGGDLLPAFLGVYRKAKAASVVDPRGTLRRLAGAGDGPRPTMCIRVSTVKPAQLASRAIDAWEVERDHSQAGVANAFTRAAHSSYWPSVWAAGDLERQASQLLALPEPRFQALFHAR